MKKMDHLITLKIKDGVATLDKNSLHFFKDDQDLTETDASRTLLKDLPCECKHCVYYKKKTIDHINRFHSLVKGQTTPCSCSGCSNSFQKIFECNHPSEPKYMGCGKCGCSTHPVPKTNYSCKCECHASCYQKNCVTTERPGLT